MGFVEAKLVLNNDELPPSPSLNSLDVVLSDVARLEVGKKPGNGVDSPGIAVAQANAGADPDPGSPKKGAEEAEKEVPMQFPQRSEAPDCAFYMKTGACKFGSACKFNHPPKRRKPRVRAKKGAENVQLPKNAVGKQKECLFKKVEQTEKKDDRVEEQTSSRWLQQEDCKFQNNAVGKQIPPFKKFVQIEKKADEVEKSCSTSEKEDSKIPKNFIGKQIPPFEKFVQIEEKIPKNFIGKQIPPFKKFVQIEEKTNKVEKHSSMSELEDSKIPKNFIGKQIPPFKKFVQIEEKTDEVEKHCSTSELEDSKLQKNAIRKQKRLFKKFEQTEKKTDEAEKQCSMLEQEDWEANEVEKQSLRSEQEDSKADEVEKYSRWEQEDSKATEKMSKEAISGNIGIGIPECKFYKTSGKCKYGKSCKYTHSLKKIEVAALALNFLGLPIRPGEKECPYYIRTGNCKYAANCKYHHPEPTVATLEQGALPICKIGGSEQQIPFGASPLPVTPSPTQGALYLPTPLTAASPAYFPESYLHPQGLLFPSNSECNGYQIHPKRPCETECHYHPKISHLNAQGN